MSQHPSEAAHGHVHDANNVDGASPEGEIQREEVHVIASHHSNYFDHPTSPLRQIIKREALVAPVTAVSIVPECNRVLVCRGSEMESVPLLCVQNEDDTRTCSNKQEQDPSCPSAPDQTNNQLPNERNDVDIAIGDQNTYRHRAYAPWDGSGIIHGIRYAKSYSQHECTSSDAAGSKLADEPDDEETAILPHWSTLMAVFGGRNLAIVGGGGIGQSAASSASSTADKEDPFVPLYFATKPRNRAGEIGNSKEGDDVGLSSQPGSCLIVSDLIYDVRLLVVPSRTNDTGSGTLLAAIGLAQNVVEIWSFLPVCVPSTGSIPSKVVLQPRRIRKIVCEVRCITYSLSLYGWGGGKWTSPRGDDGHCSMSSSSSDNGAATTASTRCTAVTDLELAVAVGTPSSTIYLWNALTAEEGDGIEAAANGRSTATVSTLPSNVTKPVSHSLSGHDGVVFSCRFGYCGSHLASTGDDRTVRLWKRVGHGTEKGSSAAAAGDNKYCTDTSLVSSFETADDAKLITDPRYTYQLVWTTYGHTARVWDCAFAPQSDMIVSCAEDSTVRVWDVRQAGTPVATLRGFHCLNAWCVDVDANEDLAVVGGNDGTAKVWHLRTQAVLNAETGDSAIEKFDGDEGEVAGMQSYFLPKQKVSVTAPAPPMETTTETVEMQGEKTEEEQNLPPKKKKKKRKKPKARNSAQAVVGMAFHSRDKASAKLLVVARSGIIHSLDLDTKKWDSSMKWCSSGLCDTESVNIDPSSGSCVSMHPNNETVAIGTSKGEVAIVPLHNTHAERTYFSPRPHYAIQGIKWIDANNLVTLHIKGIVVWWTFASGGVSSPPTKHAVFSMGTIGVPMSIAYDGINLRLAVGDSRGNVALFDVAPAPDDDSSEQPPIKLVRKVHDKEHVNDMLFSSNRTKIISAGNDGCIVECNLVSSPDGAVSIRKALSVPFPSLTGITRLWMTREGDLIAGGYQSSNFAVWDVTRGYQMMKINTGGRQRSCIFEAHYRFSVPSAHRMAICVGRKDGETEFRVHASGDFTSPTPPTGGLNYGIGQPYHGQFLNSACFIETGVPGSSIVLSGSNDATVKLSRYHMNINTTSKDLPTHESCVRAVSASGHRNSTSVLMVTCGAKLSTAFYLLEDKRSSTEPAESEPKISLLCTNRLTKDVSMDHRITAAKAVPLEAAAVDEIERHLVLTGDSDGGLHLFIIDESLDQPRTTAAHMLSTDSRPVLCIDIVRLSRTCLMACVGDTSGEVCIWNLPGATSVTSSDHRRDCVEQFCGPLPTSPMYIFNAHQCGTNCISATLMIRPSGKDNAQRVLAICSGGDDEAICLWSGTIEATASGGETICFTKQKNVRTSQASSSAVKGIKLLGSESFGYRLYTAGHDKRVALWELKVRSGNPNSLEYVSSVPVDVSDINCLDAISTHEHNKCALDKIIVGGEGAEMLSVDPNLLRAAGALRAANYLIIAVGAGMSADSGLATYENMPEEYRELCNPLMLVQETERFQSFWRTFSLSYNNVRPHSGYDVLDKWCGKEGKLGNLIRKANGAEIDTSSHWVYSSNVDGHFGRFESFDSCICEIHGRALEWRCADKIGQAQGSDRTGHKWDEWNKKRCTQDGCASTIFHIDDIANEGEARAPGLPICKHCRRPTRPNVLMFHDTDENMLRDIAHQRDRYQAWEARVEADVVKNGRKLVILELGCGKNVPGPRDESEEVLNDCLSALAESQSGGTTTLIRINSKDAEAADSEPCSRGINHTISIYGKAEESLNQIDALLDG